MVTYHIEIELLQEYGMLPLCKCGYLSTIRLRECVKIDLKNKGGEHGYKEASLRLRAQPIDN